VVGLLVGVVIPFLITARSRRCPTVVQPFSLLSGVSGISVGIVIIFVACTLRFGLAALDPIEGLSSTNSGGPARAQTKANKNRIDGRWSFYAILSMDDAA
jgi:hypothetical protein